MGSQSGKRGLSCLTARGPCQDGIDANQMDRHRGEHVLSMGLLQAIIVCPPQAHAAHPLRKRAFYARAAALALPKGWRLLLLATGE